MDGVMVADESHMAACPPSSLLVGCTGFREYASASMVAPHYRNEVDGHRIRDCSETQPHPLPENVSWAWIGILYADPL
jgi:hypothetical protein